MVTIPAVQCVVLHPFATFQEIDNKLRIITPDFSTHLPMESSVTL